jgi:hypothetical protein
VSRLVIWPDEQSINFTQMVDGTPEESSIPKDIIVEIYKVVGNYRKHLFPISENKQRHRPTNVKRCLFPCITCDGDYIFRPVP